MAEEWYAVTSVFDGEKRYLQTVEEVSETEIRPWWNAQQNNARGLPKDAAEMLASILSDYAGLNCVLERLPDNFEQSEFALVRRSFLEANGGTHENS